MFQARVARAKAAGGGRITDQERAIIQKGLPAPEITNEANLALVEAKRRENAVDEARLKYYIERQLQGFEPNEIGFMASAEGQKALQEANAFANEADENALLAEYEAELARLEEEERALNGA